MKIEKWIRITASSVVLNGTAIECEESGVQMLNELYRSKINGYPKYFKMDALCKLGFVASELLLADEERFVPCDNRAVILFNRSSSLCNDRHYQETITEDNYFPSPAVFVYTLSNIVTGEIAIRNKYNGETSSYVLDGFDASVICNVVADTLCDDTASSALCGWVECEDENNFEALMFVVAKDGDGMCDWNENIILELKNNK